MVACIAFEMEEDRAISLPRSLFGSLWLNQEIPDATLNAFVSYFKAQLSDLDIHRIEMTCPSHIYQNFLPVEFWLARDFQLQSREFNQHIPVVGDFEARLHPMERRKLKKLHSGKLCFQEEIGSTDTLTECHEFIAECREEQGLTINITKRKFLNLCFRFNGSYQAFTARMGEDLASVVITCQPGPGYQYYYLPATDARYKKYSPMVGLMELIYEDCQHRGISVLDLGVSSIKGEIQKGLFEFKQRLGAHQSTKSTVYCEL